MGIVLMNNEQIVPGLDEKCLEEAERLTELLEATGVKQKKIDLMRPVIENTAWMKIKLDDARVAVKNSQIAISYDNGGGQKGIRENPIFKGYEALWKSYMQGMAKIIDAIPEEFSAIKQEEIQKPRTTLDAIRAKKHEG